PPTAELYTLSLHDALPIFDDRFWRFHQVAKVRGPSGRDALLSRGLAADIGAAAGADIVVRMERPSSIPIESLHGRKDNVGRSLRSEEHTSELQSRGHLVCR